MDSFSYLMLSTNEQMLVLARENGGMTMRPDGDYRERAIGMAKEGLCVVDDRKTGGTGIPYSLMTLTDKGMRRAEALAA